jgi:ElaB/YqjD/DUF883 family membrane-anchored ribosome-binding protein
MENNLLGQVQEKTDGAVQKAGELLADAGATLWENAPAEGPVGEAVGMVAAQIEAGGYYLADRRVKDLLDDFVHQVREYPIPVVAAMFGLGFVLGALLVRR